MGTTRVADFVEDVPNVFAFSPLITTDVGTACVLRVDPPTVTGTVEAALVGVVGAEVPGAWDEDVVIGADVVDAWDDDVELVEDAVTGGAVGTAGVTVTGTPVLGDVVVGSSAAFLVRTAPVEAPPPQLVSARARSAAIHPDRVFIVPPIRQIFLETTPFSGLIRSPLGVSIPEIARLSPIQCPLMDKIVYRWFNKLADHTGWAHGAMRFYAKDGVILFAAFLLIAFLEARHHGRLDRVAGACSAGASALIALGLGQLIGNAIDRLRPYEVMSNMHVIVDKTTDFSFPSDHATMAGAVAVGLLLVSRRWGRMAVVAAIAMAITRVYVGAHYPSDVITGLALGGGVAFACSRYLVPHLTKVAHAVARTRFRPLISGVSA